jgi:hypothetical protein
MQYVTGQLLAAAAALGVALTLILISLSGVCAWTDGSVADAFRCITIHLDGNPAY